MLIYIYIYIYIYTHVCVYVYIYVYIYIYIHIYIYIYVYIYVYDINCCIIVIIMNMYIYIYIYTHTNMYIYIYIHTHVCIYIYTYMCIGPPPIAAPPPFVELSPRDLSRLYMYSRCIQHIGYLAQFELLRFEIMKTDRTNRGGAAPDAETAPGAAWWPGPRSWACPPMSEIVDMYRREPRDRKIAATYLFMVVVM